MKMQISYHDTDAGASNPFSFFADINADTDAEFYEAIALSIDRNMNPDVPPEEIEASTYRVVFAQRDTETSSCAFLLQSTEAYFQHVMVAGVASLAE